MRRTRRHLTYANVVSTLCLILLLGGGTAIASVIITKNSQVDSGTISGHKPPHGDHANIIAGSISGTDIADRSGVDTCKTPLTKKLGALCVGSDGGDRTWSAAVKYCASFRLHLPTISQAAVLVTNYDVPGVSGFQSFWTDDFYDTGTGTVAITVAKDPDLGVAFVRTASNMTDKTVCVTDPSA
jgi:hypothetical protein